MLYSFIIPVYNRPDHIQKLLECLTKQTKKNFEVVIVESGSLIKSDKVVDRFKDSLSIQYIYKSNEGQGVSRNRGMQEAKGDFFIILDSDVLISESYLESADNAITSQKLDAFGGPDKLHPESTTFQKAVNYCMTSLITTGGTRGRKSNVGRYYPRSFNMGVSRKVYQVTNGFKIPFLGEDIEWSARIYQAGFKVALIPEAYVNHERKPSLKGFARQIHFFGRARMNIADLVPGSFKLTHLLPIMYCLGLILVLPLFMVNELLGQAVVGYYSIYNALVFLLSTISNRSFIIGFYSLILVNVLMLAYCIGSVREFFKLFILKKTQTYTP